MKIRIKWAHAVGSGAHPEEMFDQIPRLITDIIPQSQTKFANLALNLRVTLNKMTLNFMRQKNNNNNNKNTNNFKILTKQRTKKLNKSLQFWWEFTRSSSVLFVFFCSKCTHLKRFAPTQPHIIGYDWAGVKSVFLVSLVYLIMRLFICI